MILFKMLSRGVISEIHGCISTGKEVSIWLFLCSMSWNGNTCVLQILKGGSKYPD